MKNWLNMMGCRVVLAVITSLPAWAMPVDYQPHSGDIIFQTSSSNQGPLIEKATHSPFSHMGVVAILGGKPMVYEASSKVKKTDFNQWVDRGHGRFAVKRLDQPLTQAQLSRLYAVAKNLVGKPYDADFLWSDEGMYCSELVWKIYQRGLGIKLSPLRQLKSFDLNNEAVRSELSRRHKGKIKVNEWVVAPVDIYDSASLVTVYSNMR